MGEIAATGSLDAKPVWTLDWLTPARCRAIFVLVLLLGFLGHWHYLRDNCPIDLSPDEAHYWDWSRQLDLSYYSKGPLVAYIIRASCAIFGDVAWAVRLPALVLAAGTSIATYWLTRKLFHSDRLALGVTLLNHFVPLFIAGSVLMTIDAPFYFCWALATCFAAKAIMDDAKWAWPAMGVVAGVGFLAKYAMLLWFVGLIVFLIAHRPSRRYLRTIWPWVAFAISLLFTIPVIVWNARHGWVSLFHVATQTGTTSTWHFTLFYLVQFLGGQAGILGPLSLLVVAAVIYAFHAIRTHADGDGQTRSMLFLLCMGLSFFAIVTFWSLVSKIQPNWPAPAYFTLMILTGYFLATRMRSAMSWRRWRGFLYFAIVFGALITPLIHDMQPLYPLTTKVNQWLGREALTPRKIDPAFRLLGWAELGDRVSRELSSSRDAAFVLCEDYQLTAETAFYTAGQPKTFCSGAYRLTKAKRLSQYDIWPDRSLDASNTQLLGRDAVYVGKINPDVRAAFQSIEKLQPVRIMRGRSAVFVREFQLWRAKNFKGMKHPSSSKSY